jgi:hypothetical protein
MQRDFTIAQDEPVASPLLSASPRSGGSHRHRLPRRTRSRQPCTRTQEARLLRVVLEGARRSATTVASVDSETTTAGHKRARTRSRRDDVRAAGSAAGPAARRPWAPAAAPRRPPASWRVPRSKTKSPKRTRISPSDERPTAFRGLPDVAADLWPTRRAAWPSGSHTKEPLMEGSGRRTWGILFTLLGAVAPGGGGYGRTSGTRRRRDRAVGHAGRRDRRAQGQRPRLDRGRPDVHHRRTCTR